MCLDLKASYYVVASAVRPKFASRWDALHAGRGRQKRLGVNLEFVCLSVCLFCFFVYRCLFACLPLCSLFVLLSCWKSWRGAVLSKCARPRGLHSVTERLV